MSNPDPAILHDLDAIEAVASRSLFAAAPSALRQALGLETRSIAGATLLLAPGLPTPMFNRVIGLGNAGPVSEGDLEAIAGAYRDAGSQSWWIHVSPGAQASSLAGQLAARGFTTPPRKAWVKVQRGNVMPATVDTSLDVRLARPEEAAALAATTCAAFEMPATMAPWFESLATHPEWRAVAAFDHGQVVGGGYLHLQGSRAWLGAGGVRPEARRQHAHRALMTLRIRLAIDAGCDVIATETGEPAGDEPNPSLRNMEACGFARVFSRLNLAAPV